MIPSRRTNPFNYRLPPSTPGDDVILLWGQSNMVGKATDYNSTDDPSDSRIRAYTFGGSTVSPATEPIQHRDPTALGGPGLAFAREWLTLIPANRNVMLVAASAGGTGFSLPDSNSGSLTWDYTQPIDANNLFWLGITQFKAALAASGAGSRVIGMLINIGGTDALNAVSQATFDAYIDAFIPKARLEIGIPNLPIVFGPSRPDAIAGNTNYQNIYASQKSIPGRQTRTAFLTGATGTEFNKVSDSVHFNMVGHRPMGVGYARALNGILNGLPTLTAPTVSLKGTAATTALEIQWTRPTGITGFRVQYKTTASGTWLDAPTSADTSALSRQFTSLSSNTSYDFRVASIDGSFNVGSYSTTFTQATASTGSGGPYDALAGSYRAVGLRKLYSGYTGPLVKVRRSSDNATQDINADGSGNLDTAALATFVGSNSAYIDTWYDQSGNARHMTAVSTSVQPRIVNAGTNDSVNSKIAVRFDGTMYMTASNPGLFAASANSLALTFAGSPASNSIVISENGTGSGGPAWRPLRSSTAAINVQATNGSGTSMWASTVSGDTTFDGAAHQYFYNEASGAINTWRDNATKHVNLTATRSGTTTPTIFAIGAHAGTTPSNILTGYVQELVTWTQDMTADRTTIQTIQKTYWSTP